jgi:hypothetical protein
MVGSVRSGHLANDAHERMTFNSEEEAANWASTQGYTVIKNDQEADPVFKADEDLPLEEKADASDPREEEESVMKKLERKWFETTGERLR